MDYQALKAELDAGHPDTGAYNVDNALAANELNAINRTSDRSSMSGDEIFAATDNTEFIGLSDHHRDLWVSFTSKDVINAFETTNIEFVDYVFGPASTTKSTLAGLRTEDVSRATEIGLDVPNASHVTHARSL